MASIDERVVAMSFENTKFEASVAVTMATLKKLDDAIKNIGQTSGLSDIEKAANKVTLTGPLTALDKLKQALGFPTAPQAFSDLEKDSDKVNFEAPSSALDRLKQKLGFGNAPQAFSDLENASNKTNFETPSSALDKLKQKLGFGSAPQAFADLENASNKTTFTGPSSALDKLKQKLGFPTAPEAFASLETSADRVTFTGLSRAIDGIGSKFSVMSGAAAVALGNIEAKAVGVAANVVKAFSLDPVTAGFHNYETQINAVQTILANTGLTGKSGLDQVNNSLNTLNTYANQTIYNFSEMAKNIGTFTAAGVDLKTSTEAIKGIANLAALSGSNSEQASTAMYQLSQAIAAGKVGLQDWNSVVNAGMGGTVFQRALAETAEKMGTLKDGAVKLVGPMKNVSINGQSFREAIQAKPGEQSWLTSDVLTTTLKQFTGDLSDAQLKAEGFNASEIKAIQAQAQVAVAAATHIKTFSQLTDALKEEVGTAWANIFKTLFGNINQATTLFTGLHNFLENALTSPLNNINKELEKWAALGGRKDFLAGLKQGFEDLKAIFEPIKQAFRDIFPSEGPQGLLKLTEEFKNLMDQLKPSQTTIENIRHTFDGLFAVLHIGWTIIKDVAKVIGDVLFPAAGKAGGGILQFTGNIGEFLMHLDKAISAGKGFAGFFAGLENILKVPIELIKQLAQWIGSLFGGADTKAGNAFAGSIDNVTKALGPLAPVLDFAKNAWDKFVEVLNKVKNFVSPILDDIGNTVSHFVDTLANAIQNADFSKISAAMTTLLTGGIFVVLKKFLSGEGININLGGGVFKSLSETLETLTGRLEAMQKNIQAHTLLAIAAALAVLAAGIALLSLIDPKKLSNAMTAVAIGMGELVGAMALLNKAAGGSAFIRMPFIAGSMLILSAALVVLAGAVKIFSTMSWEDLAKGLLGAAGALTAVAVGTQLINGPKLLVTAAALLPLAVALNILAVAVKIFATLSWEQLGKGLLGVGVALGMIGLAMNAFPPTAALMGPSLVLIAVALTLLSGAVEAFGHMKLETIFQGIFGIAASLTMLGVAIDLIPPTLALQAAGLVLVAVGLTALSGAIAILGRMNILTLVQGIAAMGGALVVLGLGLTAMSGTLPGSVALLAAAAAFALLTPSLVVLGNLSWGDLLKGLVGIAATLGVLAVGGLLAAPALLALGAAMIVLGTGLTLVGAAVFLAATGISKLSDTSVKAMAAMIAAITAFLAAFPGMIVSFIKGLVATVEEVAKVAPKVTTALVTIVGTLLNGLIQLAPKAAEAVGALITGILTILNNNAGPIFNAGLHLLLTLMNGLANNIGPIVNGVTRVVVNFLAALANNAPKLVTAGANALLHFVSGLVGQIPALVASAVRVVTTFVNNITGHIPSVVAAAGRMVASFISSVANQVPKVVAAGTNIIVNFINGVGNAVPRIITAAVNAATKFVNALQQGLNRLVDVGFNALINFLNGIANSIRRNEPQLWNAGWNIASAIIEGMWNGLVNLASKILDKIGDIAHSAVHKFESIIGIGSPSKVFAEIGGFMMQGLANGLDEHAVKAMDSAAAVANKVLDVTKAALDPANLQGVMVTEPVIKPVLDLTDVKKQAPQLGDIVKVPPITAAVSTDQAAIISTRQAAAVGAGQVVQAEPTTQIKFEQNNYSPDPLSSIELYRQTNNQLARLKALVAA